MSADDWHGWRVPGGPAVHVGHLPARISPALYVVEGGRLDVLAYFRDAAAARRALQVLDLLANARVSQT